LRVLPSPRSTLFPYTTLFRSPRDRTARARVSWSSFANPWQARDRGFVARAASSRSRRAYSASCRAAMGKRAERAEFPATAHPQRSEEHTSELQSLRHLVCRLL